MIPPTQSNPAPRFSPRMGGRPGRFWHRRFSAVRGQTARHGGPWTPCITRVPIQPNPVPRLFPLDGREAGALFDAVGSQRCVGRQPGMAGYEHPISPVCRPSRIQCPGFSLRTGGRSGRFLTPSVLRGAGADSPVRRVMDTPHHPCAPPTESSALALPAGREESGRLLWGTALSQGVLRDVPQYVIYSPARQRAKNRQPLLPAMGQGLPVFVLGFLPHRGRGIGGLVLVGLGPVVQVQGVVLGDVVA